VEVFSKSSGQWVAAKVICVQEDNDGIFVTVCRSDGHELDYDIDCVRAIQTASIQPRTLPTENTKVSVAANEGQNSNFQKVYHQGHFDFSEQQTGSRQNLASAQMPGAYQPQPQPQPSITSDAEWFRRMESFHIFDKIRTVKNYLQRKHQDNEPLPQTIVEELDGVVEMLQKKKNVL